MCWLYKAAVLTLFFLCSVFAQDCIPTSGFKFFELIPLPTSDPFTNSASTLGPSCSQSPSTSVWECFPNNPLPVLIDGQLGEVQSSPSVSAIYAWSRSQQQTVTITFQYSSRSTQVRHIRLYFYYVPSMGIGLPDIALTAGTSQSYYVTGNQNLSSTDAQRRMVVLSFTNTLVLSIRYTIQFTFGTSSKVDWLLLSEVEMCTLPHTVLTPTVAPALVPTVPVVRSSDNVSPNLTLSCTVSGEGRFRWEWSGPQNPEMVWFSDFTRTSTAEFTGIRGLTSVDTAYSCRATYDPTIAGRNFSMSVSRNFDVTLDFDINSMTTNVMIPIGHTVSLSCEASGYLPGPIPDFIWLDRNSELNNGSIYTITTMDGSESLQNGGSLPVPSIVSELSFIANTSIQNEPLSCQFQERVLVLLVSTPSSISDSPPTGSDETIAFFSQATGFISQAVPPEIPSVSYFVTFIATATTLIVFVILVAVTVCIVIVVLCMIYRRKKQSSISDPIYELPTDTDKETVIMKESVAYGVITETQEPCAMSKCNAYDF